MTELDDSIESNSGVVQVIMLMRIYDLLWVDLAARDPRLAAQVSEMHEIGEFVGPEPSIAGPAGEEDDV